MEFIIPWNITVPKGTNLLSAYEETVSFDISKVVEAITAAMEKVAQGMKEMAEAEGAVKVPEAGKKETKQKQASAEEAVTVEKVRAVLAEKSRDGKTQEVRKLLNEFGADKLSAIPEDRLSDLLKKAEVL